VLHLIPTPLAEDALHSLPAYLHPLISSIKIWCVEDLRTARRFLKQIDKTIDIDSLIFFEVNEHKDIDAQALKNHFAQQAIVGLMSDAGCPAIADPGASVVALAHDCGVVVRPHVGPSSILLALIASGLQGQQFAFHGYLPVKNPVRSKAIKKLETDSIANNSTQIFIETPYRNQQLLQEIIGVCNNSTRLCVAIHLSAADEKIITLSIADWKKTEINFHKVPAIFCLLG
jgi:16S rRNA (cytidine1402-2'-O)-methyltransferase